MKMTQSEHKLMLQGMKEKYILHVVSSGDELAWQLANAFGKGWYTSHKKTNSKKIQKVA